MTHDPSALSDLGAALVDGGVRFRVWTTRATEVAVVLYDRADDGSPVAREARPLEPRGDGLFEAFYDLPEGTLYRFKLGDAEVPDPYARALPFGLHGPAEVVRGHYQPRATDWRPRPLADCVLYELHIGTFTPEGTFAAAAARLPLLAELGITAIELMPLSSFPGARGWGYDGVAHFAPYAGYGPADDLRALVEVAHGLGMNVLLDVVYNHFGPEGNYLSSYAPEYFAHDVQTPWGDALNFATPAMRRLVLDNVRYWLTEFGFDGLRLDATHAMVDPTERPILAELTADVRGAPDHRILIAEDETNDPAIVLGVGLDAIWADDFHHSLHVVLTGERDGYYGAFEPSVQDLARCIERGFLYEGQAWPPSGKPRGADASGLPAPAFVYCLQNHDQVGNRALGERLHHLTSLDKYCAASALLLFLPMTPLLWMGQEWAASAPWLFFTDHPQELGEKVTAGRRAEFQLFAAFHDPEQQAKIPDPQDPATFERSRLDWSERDAGEHAGVLALYRALLHLRRDDPTLRQQDRSNMSVGTVGDHVLWVLRRGPAGDRVLVIDFGPEPQAHPPGPPPGREWQLLLTSGGEVHPDLPPARAAIYGASGDAT
ncbi:malto-oligosyltrehalose trehalohydrolase [Nannocystis bainbridge]|uniref:Malto-oligosyltrehalose trehalohydrolase n=1 Tax=Nannocystis bainbridge TaxID=2995303 RepID=A0ABT5E144_9BACT|nr:malto-oligosyltrehalose trehalohydrolase [Nannocystis bainbridge]MDC0719034.1 malto-oligosyltrehalose trehalohydrolase [Nannocystis bainbridge]